MPSPKQNTIRFFLTLLAICALVYGLATGQAQAVWQKAVFVCFECIGIG